MDNKGLITEANGGGKGCGDGVVGSFALRHEALFAFNDGNGGLLDLPLTDIAEGLFAVGGLLGSLRARPTVSPIIGELFNERGLDFRWLIM